MDIVHKFGYLAIGVNDLAAAPELYSRFARLDLSEVVGSTAFMTGGLDHHWVRLEEGNSQGVKRVGYEITNEDSDGVVRDGLNKWGIEFDEGGDPSSLTLAAIHRPRWRHLCP